MAGFTKLEYCEHINCDITKISELGLQGWEMAGVYFDLVHRQHLQTFVFKRPKVEA